MISAASIPGPRLADVPHEHVWSFPHRYVAQVLGANLPTTVIVALGSRVSELRRGDRIIVDMSARVAVAGGTSVLVNQHGNFDLIEPKEGEGPSSVPPKSGWRIFGKKIGRVTTG